MKDFIKINENDNVIVAIKELAEGEKVTVDGKEYTAVSYTHLTLPTTSRV